METPTTPTRTDWRFLIGEALKGDGNEIAHVDVLIGKKNGPVGYGFSAGLAGTAKGHTTLLAVAAPNLAVKPAVLLVNKVTIGGAKAAVQHFGPAQEAVAKAVLTAVEKGLIPKDKVEELVIIVSVFIHWQAESNERIAAFNFAATYAAIESAVAGKPDIDAALTDGLAAKHPFGSGAEGWKQDEYEKALASVTAQ